jgi:hypothetical protein
MTFKKPSERFVTNISDPDVRLRVWALMGGKVIGLVLTAMKIFLAPALQAQAPASGPSPEINAINTAWTLIAAQPTDLSIVGLGVTWTGRADPVHTDGCRPVFKLWPRPPPTRHRSPRHHASPSGRA